MFYNFIFCVIIKVFWVNLRPPQLITQFFKGAFFHITHGVLRGVLCNFLMYVQLLPQTIPTN